MMALMDWLGPIVDSGMSNLAGLGAIIWLDIVLSGDNALVIGIAASTVPVGFRRKAIVFGLVLATVVRILFAGAATYLLEIPGLLFAGGLALLWVAYSLYKELRQNDLDAVIASGCDDADSDCQDRSNEGIHSLYRALVTITVADISMSIDNVLAVAAIARGDIHLLVFGLGLSIALMGFCATLVLRVLLRYRWISFIGVLLLVVIGAEMMREGWSSLFDMIRGYLA